ncbi:MAG TPA: alpha-galactosidase, partial [Chloroflexota bacterium]|nr:alpha-galactosidase [Chloroflexota bacterium]
MSRQSDPRAARQSQSPGPAILRTSRLRFRYDPATGCYAISTVAAPLLVALEAGAQLGLVRPGGIAETRHTGSANLDGWHEEATPDGIRLTTRRVWPDGLLMVQRFELVGEVPELRASATLRPPPDFNAAIRWFSPLAPPDNDRPNLVVSPWGPATHLLDIGWTANEPARSLPVNAHSPRELVATGLGALGSAEHGTALTVGFLDGHQAVGEYRLRLGNGDDGRRGLSFAATARLDPIDLPEMGLELAPLSLSFAPLDTALCRFARSLGAGHAPPQLPPLALWQMPTRQTPPTEEATLDELSAVMNHPIATDVDYVGLPVGWEARSGDWNSDSRRFPRGLRVLRDQIHAHSSRAALPIAPFVVAAESHLAREHPTWLVRSESSDPLAVPDGRGSDFYVLDASQQPVREWLEKLGRLVAAEWGFDLARVGHLTPETWDGWRQREGVSPLAAYREGVRAFREGLAGVPLLATDGPLFGAPDLAEILQSDAAPLLSARVTPLLRCFLREVGIPLTAGPAVIGAKDQSLEEARAVATIAALSGGVASPDGDLGTLRPERWQLWQVCLPPFPGALYPFDPFAPSGPHLFGAMVDRPWEEWLLLL